MAATVADLAERALRRLGVAAVAAADLPPTDTSSTLGVPEIATAALVWVGAVAAGETPDPADQRLAEAKAAAVYDGLVAQGIVSWEHVYRVPRYASEELVMLTALHLAPSFGKAADPAGVPVIEQRLRRMALLRRARPLALQAVMDVHSSLDARGKVRWGVFDIPDWAEGPYVALAANLLAPQFELRADELAEARALRELAQGAALPASGDRPPAEYF